ncbi:MAG: GHMP kinase [Gammaproteobacteria bacterium]|nr:GHMP kinase [Gammaproteobacteria bacterium]
MLFGEHAVLHGSKAIVVAVEHYITVELTPRLDRIIKLNSELIGSHQFDLDHSLNYPDKTLHGWRFVMTAILSYRPQLETGFELNISSDFSDQLGLGSSAAVTVATLTVLSNWLDKKEISALELIEKGATVVRKVQGLGSGADIAASVLSGAIIYQMDPLDVTKLAAVPQLKVVYSGSKTPTCEVVKQVETLRARHPELINKIYTVMGSCVEEACRAINQQNWHRLGELMDIHQGLQDSLGTNNATLAKLIFELRSESDITGAKISGSGLGDCVIGCIA